MTGLVGLIDLQVLPRIIIREATKNLFLFDQDSPSTLGVVEDWLVRVGKESSIPKMNPSTG